MGSIGRAFIDSERGVVWKQESFANVISLDDIGAFPGITHDPGIGGGLFAVRPVANQLVIVVAGVHEPTEGQLFLVIDARRGECLFLRPAKGRQQQGGQDGNDGNDYEQFD